MMNRDLIITMFVVIFLSISCSEDSVKGPADAATFADQGSEDTQLPPGFCETKDDCIKSCWIGKCNSNNKCDYVPDKCDDGKICTKDVCEEDVGCVHMPNTATCDDNNSCTEISKCDLESGKCVGDMDSWKVCNDDNVCTDDSCDPGKGCVYKSIGNVCDLDENLCTVDVCQDSLCVNTDNVICDDGVDCTDDLCVFESGKCVFTVNQKSCDDGKPCTADSCDLETLKECIHEEIEDCCSTDVECDDEDSCTVNHQCIKNTCTKGINVCECTKSGDCDDKNLCTTDTCTANSKCKNESVDCKDGIAYTIDSCVLGTGKCAHSPDHDQCKVDAQSCIEKMVCTSKGCKITEMKKCKESDVCTVEKCISGVCITKTTKVCEDNNPCTKDFCDSKTGDCAFTPSQNGIDCNDNDSCTTSDGCKDGKCLGMGVECVDKNPCTKDSCDQKTGKCTFIPMDDGAICTDMNVCTLNDKCKGSICTGKELSCDDGDLCTTDSCNKTNGCQYKPIAGCKLCKVNKDCSDGKVCTADYCDLNGKCHHEDFGCCGADKDCKGSKFGEQCATVYWAAEKKNQKFCVECDNSDPKDQSCDYKNGKGCAFGIEWFFYKTIGRPTQVCI